MKHTPGPLSIRKAEDTDNPDWAIVDIEGRIIGEAFDLVYFDIRRPAKANARLWAAAPEMYKALKIALDALGCDCLRQDRMEAQKIIRAALNAVTAQDERSER